MIHELKIKPEYFAAVVSGDKTFEIRNNADRNFKVGDTLLLWEWDEGFTSQTAERTVSYITDFEQKPGYVVLGLASKREQELAEQLADATRQCGVMAELLREANNSVYFHLESPDSRLSGEEAGKLIALTESIADALAGKLPDRQDTEWTDAATSPVAADYRELQEQHDQLQSKHRGALDLLHELREGAEIHLHNCNVCKNEDGVNNWTGKLARIDAALAGHVVSQPLRLLIQMTDILKMCRSALITAYEDILDGTAKGVIQYRIKLATKGINMAEHAIDAAAQANSGRFITEGQELELITVLQSIVNGFSDDPAHDAAALLKRITGEVPWTGDSFQLPPHQGGEPCAIEPRSSSPA
ncbi:ASCH/PUA domain-containing protein [Aeromonas jandaei]|uniref:ASCH/PUA domain-containing protein n=1 Tax=Aeromonas jandaei TaxID=650 RepID=UPI003B9E73D5